MCVIMEEALEVRIMQEDKNSSPFVGLLIGQRTTKNYYVVHAVTTRLKNFNGPVREISETDISRHSLTVTTMLPGGFNILGVFLITSEELWNTEWNYIKIKSILRQVRLQLMTKKIFCGIKRSDKLILLQLNPELKETFSWEFSYGEVLEDIQPIKLILKSLNTSFYVGEYAWNYSSPYREIDLTEVNHHFDKYWKLMNDFKNQVNKSTFLLNRNKVPSGNAMIKDYLISSENPDSSSEEDEDDIDPNQYRLKGHRDFTMFVCIFKPIYNYSWSCIQGENIKFNKVYVHTGMTVSEVCQVVKEDLVRCWASQLQLHLDRISDGNGIMNGPMKKISILLEKFKIPFYTYIFENEPLCSKILQGSLQQNLSLKKSDNYLLLDNSKEQDSAYFEGEWKSEEGLKEGTFTANYLVTLFSIFILYGCLVYQFMFSRKYTPGLLQIDRQEHKCIRVVFG